MNYLSPSEYEEYGLEVATPESWIAAASKLIDAHCRRATLAVASYTERLRVTAGRNSVRLSYLPLAGAAPITAARGRFAVPRRGETASDFASDVSRAFGLPGAWSTLDPAQFDFDGQTGDVTFPAYILGLPFNEVEVTYNAGLATIADEVKFACAQIVKNAQSTPALNVKSGKVEQIKLDYFSDSLLDSSVRKMLAPYVAQKLG
jgi:hypothetical protein